MKSFVNKLHQAFAAAAPFFVEAGVPAIAHIDKMRGQPLNPELFETYELPAVFWAVRIKWTRIGRTYQGEMLVEFHVQQDATWEISNIATNLQEGLKQVDLISLVRCVLDNMSSDNTGKLIRDSESPVDTGVTPYDVLMYSCNYTDPGVVSLQQLVDAMGDFNLRGKLKVSL